MLALKNDPTKLHGDNVPAARDSIQIRIRDMEILGSF